MADQAKFVQGSTMRHIFVMSGAGAIGLMALFLVDLLDMFFISLLGQVELAAAIGFAGTLVFFSTSVSIGTSIAMGALVSKALGAKQIDSAKRIAASTVFISCVISILVSASMLYWLPELLAMIGATGVAAEKAADYLYILLPSSPLIAAAMAGMAALRAVGDAKRSMYATLSGGIVNAVFDPIFIFGLGMGVEGAAIASVLARMSVLAFSLWGLIRVHNLIVLPTLASVKNDFTMVAAIAFPAIITNTATPIGNAIVTSHIAQFGEDYVAGFAVIGRIIPVSFAVIFSLSGAVGPIIGQNFGAERLDRVKDTLKNALIFTTVYCVLVAVVLYYSQQLIIDVFKLDGGASEMIVAFCTVVAITFVFNGALFVANTSFNNLGRPLLSTVLNLGKATLGTLPFVYIGALYYGAEGVLYGQAAGSILFGLIGIYMVNQQINEMVANHECVQLDHEEEEAATTSVNMTPFCSSESVMIQEVPTKKDPADLSNLSG
ncbi:MATE family efflux transporter [Vibrio sp. Of7-15]|uniref:MATE family efflux transporter n=1 Tax=Vibrio sp. Of7-15 TaxID=2724879 RepID=UPI001EF233BF|nr:MATE family efflux transporter [Vibrio sp. Of7-15]